MTYSSEFPVTTSQSQTHQNPPPIDRLIQPQNQPIGTNLGEPYLRIEGVNKSFGSFVALREIYLDVYPGEFVCLLGPSGCGKTTLLRIIAGLEQQTSGRVIQGGKDVSNLPTSRRDFGIVFQSYALFPNLTVEQNIGYGLHNEGRPKSEIQAKVNELIDLVGLEGNAHKYPSQMSGGQQQRVALARALAQSPGLLLLDEPLSALDAKVREKLRSEITHLQKRLGITTVMVTHDQAEALSMADRVVVMDKGYIAQVGTPHNIYQEPNSPFVANFIGIMNFLKGIVLASNQVCCGNITLSTGVQSARANP
ncbi:MAG: ATP-binding cassette domain-containing protein [Oscillatoriales cyanobacterium RM1_1_9]|nr:ATP-binding cassette domain-containing protein [Oscillatoriales cyanobacterium RM1_1_9]